MATLRGVLACASLLLLGASGDTRPLDALQSHLDQATTDPAVPGAALCVVPGSGAAWTGVSGGADPDSARAFTPDTPFRVASITKTYVAAAILRLWEQDRLDLEAALPDLLPAASLEPLVQDGYDPASITVRHLLTHTAGLFDYAMAGEYFEAVLEDPRHRWTRGEQLQGAADWGDPLGAPGEIFHYSDSGYILLGAILERATGQDLGRALRGLLRFEALGLEHTWLESIEPAPPGLPGRAHQYVGELDTFGFDPSMDLHGGGGLVSTVEDLARFFAALGRGEVFDDPATLDTMLAPTEGVTSTYRLGIDVRSIAGHEVLLHTGVWGVIALYVPELDAAVAATVTQEQSRGFWTLAEAAVAALGDADRD